jgi:integrase-like protein
MWLGVTAPQTPQVCHECTVRRSAALRRRGQGLWPALSAAGPGLPEAAPVSVLGRAGPAWLCPRLSRGGASDLALCRRCCPSSGVHGSAVDRDPDAALGSRRPRAGWLNLADSKTGAKTVYLNVPVRRLLAALARLEGNPFVVPGERRGQHLVNLEKPWRMIRELTHLSELRLHDLRHSYASIGAGAGLGLPVIGALLGHAQAATTHRYAHLASDPLRQAADLIGNKLAAPMTG